MLPPHRPAPDAAEPPRRPRGQQRGSKGHGRRDYSHLPAAEEVIDLPADQRRCQRCGQPFAAFPGTDDTTVLEVEVRAHRRVFRRRRYRPTCSCGTHPGIVTAPPPPRLIPKSILGVSIWVDRAAGQVPVLPPDLPAAGGPGSTHGLDLSQGTPDRRPATAAAPVRAGVRGAGRAQPGADACGTPTRPAGWSSPPVEGKVGYRWYLWVFHAADVVVFVLAPGRSHDVPEEHFGPVEEGILVVDRYAAYQAIDTGQGRDDRAGLLLGARASRLPGRWPGRGRSRRRGRWAGWTGSVPCTTCNDRRLECATTARGSPQRDQELRAAVDGDGAAGASGTGRDRHCTRRGGRCWRACGTTGRG